MSVEDQIKNLQEQVDKLTREVEYLHKAIVFTGKQARAAKAVTDRIEHERLMKESWEGVV